MPRFYLFIVGLAGLLLGSRAGWAQQASPPISGDFNGLRFEQFAQRVEAQTPYRFFFDPATLDSVTVRVRATDQPLTAVLRQVFERSSLRFAIDEATGRVFITPEYPVQTQLPADFFQDAAPGSGRATPADVAAAAPRPNQPAQVGTSEFRVYEIGPRQASPAGGRATLTGVVRDAKGEPVFGAAVYVESPNIGTATDKQGAYSLTRPAGRPL